MSTYWNSPQQKLLQHVGNVDQLASVRRVALLAGRAKGTEAFEVSTGAGLNFTVLVDRALDIADARWCGRSLCWQSSAGLVGPAYYERPGTAWLRGFGGGLLTTCGLRNVGPSCEDEGETFGLHGEVSFTPAANASARGYWSANRYCMEINGEVRESYPFGPNLCLRRRWRTELGANWIELEDVITNEGFRDELHMQLYHWNLGFPLVNADTRIYTTTDSVASRDEDAERGISGWGHFQPPTESFLEQVFFHSYSGTAPEETSVLVAEQGEHPSLAVLLSYNSQELPRLIQWKMCGLSDYVLGIEPANCLVVGRIAHRRDTPTFLHPGQTATFHLRMTVLTDEASISSLAKGMTSA
jgi:Domain of unknown function (DUF4432)